MADLQHLVEELSKLTVLEAAELSKKLEEAWGVSTNFIESRIGIAAATSSSKPTPSASSMVIMIVDPSGASNRTARTRQSPSMPKR